MYFTKIHETRNLKVEASRGYDADRKRSRSQYLGRILVDGDNVIFRIAKGVVLSPEEQAQISKKIEQLSDLHSPPKAIPATHSDRRDPTNRPLVVPRKTHVPTPSALSRFIREEW